MRRIKCCAGPIDPRELRMTRTHGPSCGTVNEYNLHSTLESHTTLTSTYRLERSKFRFFILSSSSQVAASLPRVS